VPASYIHELEYAHTLYIHAKRHTCVRIFTPRNKFCRRRPTSVCKRCLGELVERSPGAVFKGAWQKR
jgi:hypothetical protein